MNYMKLGIIEQIDTLIGANWDYEIDLTDEEKNTIAQDIIDFEDDFWETLNCILLEKMERKFNEKYEYLKEKEKVAPLDKDELLDYSFLKDIYEGNV